MASNDSDAEIDYRLVRTYAPAMLLFMRAALILSLYATLVFGLGNPAEPAQKPSSRMDIAILVLSCSAYLDGWLFRNDALSRAVGFLAPPLLLILTMSDQFYPGGHTCNDLASLAVYYSVGILWAASSSFCVVDMLVQVQSRFNVHVAAACWGAACVVLVFVDCRKRGFLEILARTMLYYIFTVFLWFSQTLQPDRERHRFCFSILHASLHVLFVDPYVVAGSVVIFIAVFVYHYNAIQKPSARPGAPQGVVLKKADVSENLLRELQAAKRAQATMV